MADYLISVLSVAQSPGIKRVSGGTPIHLTPLNWQLRYHFFFIVNTKFYSRINAYFFNYFSFCKSIGLQFKMNVIFYRSAAVLRRTQKF